eukprot:965830-Prorocentrum_minimum.AAC.2
MDARKVPRAKAAQVSHGLDSRSRTLSTADEAVYMNAESIVEYRHRLSRRSGSRFWASTPGLVFGRRLRA